MKSIKCVDCNKFSSASLGSTWTSVAKSTSVFRCCDCDERKRAEIAYNKRRDTTPPECYLCKKALPHASLEACIECCEHEDKDDNICLICGRDDFNQE